MIKKKDKRNAMLQEAKKARTPLKHAEFKCPNCKGVASVIVLCGQLKAECHNCGMKVTEVS